MSEEEKEAIKYLETHIIPYLDSIGNIKFLVNNIILNYIDKQQKVIEEIKNKLEEHIKFCEQEAKGHLENNVCHISLKFDKSLLEIIEKVEEENG